LKKQDKNSVGKDDIEQIFAIAKIPPKNKIKNLKKEDLNEPKPGKSKPSSEDLKFSDSRGKHSQSKNRKTEKDWGSVYSPDELKIGEGGDTPDCPFDCKCCF